MTARPFVGCSMCAYSIPSGRGPIPRIPRATLSVQTPRGVRQLCDLHAAGFVVPNDLQTARDTCSSFSVAPRSRVPR